MGWGWGWGVGGSIPNALRGGRRTPPPRTQIRAHPNPYFDAQGPPGAQAQPQLHAQAQTQQRVSYARPRRGVGGRGSGRGRGGHRRSRSDHTMPWAQSQGSGGNDFESSRHAGQYERQSAPCFGPGIPGTPQAQVAALASASAAAPMATSMAVAEAGSGRGGIGASLSNASSSANSAVSSARGRSSGGIDPRSAGAQVEAKASGGSRIAVGRMVARHETGDGGDVGASPASAVGRVTVGATPHQKLPPKPGSRHGRKTKVGLSISILSRLPLSSDRCSFTNRRPSHFAGCERSPTDAVRAHRHAHGRRPHRHGKRIALVCLVFAIHRLTLHFDWCTCTRRALAVCSPRTRRALAAHSPRTRRVLAAHSPRTRQTFATRSPRIRHTLTTTVRSTTLQLHHDPSLVLDDLRMFEPAMFEHKPDVLAAINPNSYGASSFCAFEMLF